MKTQDYWEKRALDVPNSLDVVEFSQRSQERRFTALSSLIPRANASSFLDIGCGLAAFESHLQRTFQTYTYMGLDISPAMIVRCKEKSPTLDLVVGDWQSWSPPQSFDYVVSFGTFSVLTEDLPQTLDLVLEKLYMCSEVASHISLISSKYLGETASHIKRWDIDEVVSVCNKLSPLVMVSQDYLPHDFSVTMFHSRSGWTLP